MLERRSFNRADPGLALVRLFGARGLAPVVGEDGDRVVRTGVELVCLETGSMWINGRPTTAETVTRKKLSTLAQA